VAAVGEATVPRVSGAWLRLAALDPLLALDAVVAPSHCLAADVCRVIAAAAAIIIVRAPVDHGRLGGAEEQKGGDGLELHIWMGGVSGHLFTRGV
jgi:hypothetical protein